VTVVARALMALVVTAAWLTAGCGDDLGRAADAGTIFDAVRYTDADVVICSPGDGDAGCGEQALTPVCDEERGVCVECSGDADCDRAGAFGPECRAGGTCACASDAECDGNSNGPRCHEVVRACTCIDDGDCDDGEDCKMEPYLGAGVRTCVRM
jgi:hypothetical protein